MYKLWVIFLLGPIRSVTCTAPVFPLNSQLLNFLTNNNITEIGREIWKLSVESHLHPLIQYDFTERNLMELICGQRHNM